MDLLIDIIGYAAVAIMLGAYAATSRGRLSSRSASFQTLNIVGGVMAGANSFVHGAWPSVSANALWIIIGIATLIGMHRAHHTATDEADEATGDGDTTDDDAGWYTDCGEPVLSGAWH